MTRSSLREALRKYGDSLCLAGIEAIEKKGHTEEVRIIFDATHGVLMNHIVRVRDLVRNPTAADIEGFLEVMADEQVAHFSIVYDVSFAHRQVAVEEAEWGRLGCQLEGTAAQTMRDQLPTLRRR